VWTYAVPGAAGSPIVLRKEKDVNGDGRVDTWERYGPDGTSVVEAAFDLDFDGGADLRLAYENGRLVRTELAPRPDGVPRTWSHFEGGKLVRKERDADGDGKVDGWDHWHGGELDRIGVDLDGDGRADRWEARPQAPSRADQK
jgi:hypothetical protein